LKGLENFFSKKFSKVFLLSLKLYPNAHKPGSKVPAVLFAIFPTVSRLFAALDCVVAAD
jgi:hypothetical protein